MKREEEEEPEEKEDTDKVQYVGEVAGIKDLKERLALQADGHSPSLVGKGIQIHQP